MLTAPILHLDFILSWTVTKAFISASALSGSVWIPIKATSCTTGNTQKIFLLAKDIQYFLQIHFILKEKWFLSHQHREWRILHRMVAVRMFCFPHDCLVLGIGRFQSPVFPCPFWKRFQDVYSTKGNSSDKPTIVFGFCRTAVLPSDSNSICATKVRKDRCHPMLRKRTHTHTPYTRKYAFFPYNGVNESAFALARISVYTSNSHRNSTHQRVNHNHCVTKTKQLTKHESKRLPLQCRSLKHHQIPRVNPSRKHGCLKYEHKTSRENELSWRKDTCKCTRIVLLCWCFPAAH